MAERSPRGRLLFLVPEDWHFRSHFRARAKAAKADGWEVHVAVQVNDPDTPAQMQQDGLLLHPLRNYRRGRISPIATARAIMELCTLLRRVRPHLIHQATVQFILCGAIATTIAWRKAGVVNAFTGMGNVFSQKTLLLSLLRPWVLLLLRGLLLPRRMWILTQNRDDAELLEKHVGARRERIRIIEGAGVDCNAFAPQPEPPARGDNAIVVSLVARMLWSKGIEEAIEAGRLLRERADKGGVKVAMRLIGWSDAGNPRCVPEASLRQWHEEGVIEYLGRRQDILQVWGESHVAFLPTRGGEGVPRCLLEAGACARPLVTTRVPGCRDLVRDGIEGFVLEVGDAAGMADAIERLALDADLRHRLGAAARKRIEESYSDAVVVASTLEFYRRVAGGVVEPGGFEPPTS